MQKSGDGTSFDIIEKWEIFNALENDHKVI